MRLSIVQLFKKTVPGHIFRGKNRLVKPVSRKAMDTLIFDYERQEKIMLLLRHPYLTAAESAGHTKSLDKKEKLVEKWRDHRESMNLKPHIMLEDRLLHLQVNESWE